MALRFSTMSIPLASGLATGQDPRALNPPDLAVCRDAQFEEVGGLQTRYPYASIGSNIVGGGSLSNIRRIVPNGDELLCFTKDALYAWSEHDTAWALKATYLAAELTEEPAFARTSDQTMCDRAELDGVTFYTWVDAGATSAVHIAALDSETGAVLLAPTAMATSSTRPKLAALATKVLFFFMSGASTLKVLPLDPDDLATSVAASPTTVATNCNDYYDVATTSSFAWLAQRHTTTTSYIVRKINASLGGSSSTKNRTCDGPIAIAVSPLGTRVQIIRANGTDIEGDLLDDSLTDVYTAQAVGTVAGTAVYQIAAEYRSTTDSGEYRCYAFWHSQETASASSSFLSKTNWVDTGDNLGTQANFAYRLAVASRAFNHDGRVFVWMVFASQSGFSGAGTPGFRAQLQNTYFLYRDDGLLVAKAAAARAGGFPAGIGLLPFVQNTATNVYRWAGVERRIVPLATKKTGYAARVPLGITVEFDSDAARRTARLGRTFYVAGGEILQYDGTGLYEVGFHIYPWSFGAIEASSTGTIAAGTYTIKCTERWDNAQGERDRSTTATTGDVEITAGDSIQIVSWYGLNVTHKTSSTSPPYREVWRTQANPSIDAPFHLVTSQDPAVTTGSNCAVPNVYTAASLTAWQDDMPDATAATKEANPENGGVLENLAPPAASIIVSTQDRLFLAGVANAPHQIRYSKLRGDAEVAAFHETLVIDLPPDGGRITALAFMDESLVAFKETAIYAIPGDGFDNTGGGQNYGPARRVPADVGAVNAESVALSPAGLIFKSSNGWALLRRDWSVDLSFGERVRAFDADEIVAVDVIETKSQIRCIGRTSRALVFDYRVGQWSEWTLNNAVSAALWNGTHHIASSTAVNAEQTSYSSLTYGLDVETSWIKIADFQGQGVVHRMLLLGEFRSSHDLRVRVAYNYDESDASGPTWVDDKYIPAAPEVVGGPWQLKHGPARRRCQAIKFRFTPYATGSTTTPPTGEAIRLTAMALEVGYEGRLYQGLPASQKQ